MLIVAQTFNMPQTTMCKGLEACYVNRLNLFAIFPYRPCGYGYNCNHVTFLPFDTLSKCVNTCILANYVNIFLFLAPQRLHGYSCNRVTIEDRLKWISGLRSHTLLAENCPYPPISSIFSTIFLALFLIIFVLKSI